MCQDNFPLQNLKFLPWSRLKINLFSNKTKRESSGLKIRGTFEMKFNSTNNVSQLNTAMYSHIDLENQTCGIKIKYGKRLLQNIANIQKCL